MIEHHLASNSVLPTHQDSENDSLHTMMNILLHTSTKDARRKYIDSALTTIASLNKSSLGRILRDEQLFDELFLLFQMEHFRSRDNIKAGLSIRNINTWYPVIGGVSDITNIMACANHHSHVINRQ